jgi:hypothetical protein
MLPILDAGTGHYGILKRLELWNFLVPWVIVGFLGLEQRIGTPVLLTCDLVNRVGGKLLGAKTAAESRSLG